MAEIGVWRGALSSRVLEAHPSVEVVLVDPWKAGKPGNPWYESGSKMARRSQLELDRHRLEAISACSPWKARVTELRMTSREAAVLVDSKSLDLVFIDADHSFTGVSLDIDLWLPKVKPGGYIGGHDYAAPRFPGVREAVHGKFRQDRIQAGENATWFVRV
jgi:hypothetical protein